MATLTRQADVAGDQPNERMDPGEVAPRTASERTVPEEQKELKIQTKRALKF